MGDNENAPGEGVFSNGQELKFFAEALIKSINEGHIRISCDPGYPFEPVRLIHLAERVLAEEESKPNMPLNADMRLAHYYLSLHRSVLENMCLRYLKKFKDSEGLFTNEKAKADRCRCDINTIDGWLKRFSAFAVAENEVQYLNADYSHKKILSFRCDKQEKNNDHL